MPEKCFLLGARKESRMEELLCSAQERGFKEVIVSLVRGNGNIVIGYENIPNFLRCVIKHVEVNDITPGIPFQIFRPGIKEKRKTKGDK